MGWWVRTFRMGVGKREKKKRISRGWTVRGGDIFYGNVTYLFIVYG